MPGEDSSGEKHRRGRITRTGNALVRRLRLKRRGITNIGLVSGRHTALNRGRLLGQPDFAHPTFAELLEQVVMPDHGTWRTFAAAPDLCTAAARPTGGSG